MENILKRKSQKPKSTPEIGLRREILKVFLLRKNSTGWPLCLEGESKTKEAIHHKSNVK